jgi:predicted dehydrogenase/threonine dehydrogenase-like Zn-dependent dehydrogenase
MRQVVQQQSTGELTVLHVPAPVLQAQGVLVDVVASVISSGTERAMRKLAQQSLLGKARARPDLARKVVARAREQGLAATVSTVRDRLDTPDAVGYSAAGVVREVGKEAGGFRPGQLVACAGGGYASHAEIIYVPATLCAPVPDGVPGEHAAFATVGAIALHGIHQAGLIQGERVVVAGLGLIGQLTARLLAAYGHPCTGVDPSPAARAELERLGLPTCDVGEVEAGLADAVILTAATESSDLIATAPEWCRDRGRVVVVGDVGLDVPRRPYYDGEVEIRFSRSYGPGRYDPDHEAGGHDYPVGYVRWTEGRNLGEVLRLMSNGRLIVEDLITDRFPIDEAPAAYRRLEEGGVRALVLTYPRGPTTTDWGSGDGQALENPPESATDGTPDLARSVAPAAPRALRDPNVLSVSVCGAGVFCRQTLLPAFEATGRTAWVSVASATGISAGYVASRRHFRRAVGRAEDAATDPDADAVVVATRHDTHARLSAAAAGAGKAVFVEKPLAVTPEELTELESQVGVERIVTGFNRRFAPATRDLRRALEHRHGPLALDMRVNAGRLPAGHWAGRADQGGRIIGEACHFVDLACSLVVGPAVRVAAAGAGLQSPVTEDTMSVLLQFADGSTAALTYLASGSGRVPKERIEAHWDGKSAVIDDFRKWTIHTARRSTRHRARGQDKGHRDEIAAFVEFALAGGASPVPFHQAAHVTRVTFAIVAALSSGEWQVLAPVEW